MKLAFFYLLIIFFSPFALAISGFGMSNSLMIVIGVLWYLFWIGVGIFLLILHFKTWNKTNKILENINQSLKEINKTVNEKK